MNSDRAKSQSLPDSLLLKRNNGPVGMKQNIPWAHSQSYTSKQTRVDIHMHTYTRAGKKQKTTTKKKQTTKLFAFIPRFQTL